MYIHIYIHICIYVYMKFWRGYVGGALKCGGGALKTRALKVRAHTTRLAVVKKKNGDRP